MPAVGLDLSDESVRFVELIPERDGQLRLGRSGERRVPPGLIEAGRIKDAKALANVLRALAHDARLSWVAVSLPEEPAYLLDLSLPPMPESEIRTALALQLEEHVPLKGDEMVFDYELLRKPEKAAARYRLSVGVLPRSVAESYLNVFLHASLSPVSFEIESQAIARSLVPRDARGAVMIVDFGKSRTGISIVHEGVVQFSSTLPIGGETLTVALMKSLGLSHEEVERMKTEKGLSRAPEDAPFFSGLVSTLAALKDEIGRRIEFWETHPDEEGIPRPSIRQILLTGRAANLPGLLDYLAYDLEVQVALGNPWVNVLSFDEFIPSIPRDEALGYATALGLALRAALV